MTNVVIVLYAERRTKALTRLRGCAGWSAHLLFTWVFYRVAAYITLYAHLLQVANKDWTSYIHVTGLFLTRNETVLYRIRPPHRASYIKVRKIARIRNRYGQVPHLSQDNKLESNKITIDITNKSQDVSPFPSGDHKAAMNRRKSMANTGTI